MEAVTKFATENYQLLIGAVCVAIYWFRVPLLLIAKRFKLTTDATPNPNAPMIPTTIPTNLMELGKWIVDQINAHRKADLAAQKAAIVSEVAAGPVVAATETTLTQTPEGEFLITHGGLKFKVPATALLKA